MAKGIYKDLQMNPPKFVQNSSGINGLLQLCYADKKGTTHSLIHLLTKEVRSGTAVVGKGENAPSMPAKFDDDSNDAEEQGEDEEQDEEEEEQDEDEEAEKDEETEEEQPKKQLKKSRRTKHKTRRDTKKTKATSKKTKATSKKAKKTKSRHSSSEEEEEEKSASSSDSSSSDSASESEEEEAPRRRSSAADYDDKSTKPPTVKLAKGAAQQRVLSPDQEQAAKRAALKELQGHAAALELYDKLSEPSAQALAANAVLEGLFFCMYVADDQVFVLLV